MLMIMTLPKAGRAEELYIPQRVWSLVLLMRAQTGQRHRAWSEELLAELAVQHHCALLLGRLNVPLPEPLHALQLTELSLFEGIDNLLWI